MAVNYTLTLPSGANVADFVCCARIGLFSLNYFKANRKSRERVRLREGACGSRKYAKYGKPLKLASTYTGRLRSVCHCVESRGKENERLQATSDEPFHFCFSHRQKKGKGAVEREKKTKSRCQLTNPVRPYAEGKSTQTHTHTHATL